MFQRTCFATLKEYVTSLYGEKRCLACHAPFLPSHMQHTSARYLCVSCAAYVTRNDYAACMLCGHPFALECHDHVCAMCHLEPPLWDSLRFYGAYEGLLKYCLLQFKFHHNFTMLPLLVDILHEVCSEISACHMLLPMPRHQQRLASQGFNHAIELSKPLARKLQIPLHSKALVRTKMTVAQVSLSAKERKKNPANSFAASTVMGRNILLVDDIMTTGATLHHATLALRKAGCNEVHIAVICRVNMS